MRGHRHVAALSGCRPGGPARDSRRCGQVPCREDGQRRPGRPPKDRWGNTFSREAAVTHAVSPCPRYQRNQEDGSYIVGENGDCLLDADFTTVLNDLRRSEAASDFPWLIADQPVPKSGTGWSVSIKEVLSDEDYILDPKRHCRKVNILRQAIADRPHFLLGEVMDFLPEKTTSSNQKIKKINKTIYHYVELQDIGFGDYKSSEYRGWELPDRAKHFAEPKDLYVGSIWGSVSKWCLIPNGVKNVVVTNGCHRMRIKSNMSERIVDIVAFLCAEAYSVQMRAFARGSDGLAEVTENDTRKVLVPELSQAVRKELEPFVESLISGTPDLHSKVLRMLQTQKIPYPQTPKRPSHVALV